MFNNMRNLWLVFMVLAVILLIQGALSPRADAGTEAIPIPDMVCQQVAYIYIPAQIMTTLGAGKGEVGDLYRIKNSELYISSPRREEYLYNKIEYVEYQRYISGHKTLVFLDREYTELISVHVNGTMIKILKFHCTII